VTLTVICESVALYISRVRMVAGAARPIRISTGMIVQPSSSRVLWLQVSATAPFDRRKRNIAMNIAPNTRMPRATHTHSAAMCRFQIWCEIGVTPLSRFICQGTGLAAAAIDISIAPRVATAPVIRRLQLLELIITPRVVVLVVAPAAVAGQQGLQPSRQLHPFVVAQTFA